MKKMLKLLSLLCLFGLFLACASKEKEDVTPQPATEEPQLITTPKATVIYLVRHAEKATNSPTDPDLSTAGQARAQALKDSLSNVKLAAIYTTGYKRTQQTVAPTAAAQNLTPIVYGPNDLNALTTKILKDNLHKTILVVGHSNTVLETIEALQIPRPITEITESEFNYLFKVTLEENKAPKVIVKRYGN